MKATTTLYVVRRESPKACSTRSTTVYQKPRSPFACHVYTTFLHTRNAFLKSLKKKKKEKKKKNRVFLPCSHVLSVSFPALYRLLRFTAATSHDRCLLCIVDVHVPIQEHV